MTRVLIIGEAYNLGLSIGGGPMPGGPNWSGPVDPIWGVTPPTDPGYGRPGWSPVDPGYGRPDWAPGHPGNRPPGSWDGNYPTGGPIAPPRGGTEVPPEDYAPTPPPENISSQYIVSVYDPKTMTWTTKTYPPR